MELEILSHGQRIGTAQIESRGLYWQFVCRCRKTGKPIRLVLDTGDSRLPLGVPVPEGGELVLRTGIPRSRLPESAWRIVTDGQQFVPVRTGEAFAFLTKLRSAKFAVQNNTPGVLLPE